MYSLQNHLVCIPYELSAAAMAVSPEQQHRLHLNSSVLIGLPLDCGAVVRDRR